MKKISYNGYRFPPEIIHRAIWLYLRFTLSLRDVEGLLSERGIAVSYETIRRWVNHFGPLIAADLRQRRPKPHTIWHLDLLRPTPLDIRPNAPRLPCGGDEHVADGGCGCLRIWWPQALHVLRSAT